MSPKVIVIPIVAAGVAAAMFKLVSTRRATSPALSHAPGPGVTAATPDTTREPPTTEAGVLPQGPGSTTVLPIAFWDAVSDQLDADEVPVAARPAVSHDTYDAIAPEDLGVEWLSRATEAFNVAGEADDEREQMAPDSLSMIGEATRLAAASPSDSPESERFDDELDEDPSLFDAPESERG